MFFMSDRCAVNKAAWRCLSPDFPNASQLFCVSHFVNCAGSAISSPGVDSLKSYWYELFAHSDANKKVYYLFHFFLLKVLTFFQALCRLR